MSLFDHFLAPTLKKALIGDLSGTLLAPKVGFRGKMALWGPPPTLAPTFDHGSLPPESRYGSFQPESRYGSLPPESRYGSLQPESRYGRLSGRDFLLESCAGRTSGRDPSLTGTAKCLELPDF